MEDGFDFEHFQFEEPGSYYQKKNDILREKAFQFAVRCVRLAQYLQKDPIFKGQIDTTVPRQAEFVLSKQIIRSGTAIGALLREARYAQSRADFISKFSISLKEASETEYWIDLLFETNYIEPAIHKSMKADLEELIKLLTSSINTAKS